MYSSSRKKGINSGNLKFKIIRVDLKKEIVMVQKYL